MKIFDDVDIERQIHDETLQKDLEIKTKLKGVITEYFNLPRKQLESDKALVDIIMQLLRYNHPLIYEYNDDIWSFLANNLEDNDWELPNSRFTNKNSFYNRSKAKAYIETYWKNYNPAYPAFQGGGGDCANFVSQVLYAGGMPWVDDSRPANYTWFTNWYCKPGATNKDGDRRITLSWKVAASFRRHWEKRAAKQLVISYKDAINNMKDLSKQIYVGDPVQFCYANGVSYHTLIVTGYAWDKEAALNDIVLASHTIDSNRRSLYHTMMKYPKDYQLRVYVIKEGQ